MSDSWTGVTIFKYDSEEFTRLTLKDRIYAVGIETSSNSGKGQKWDVETQKKEDGTYVHFISNSEFDKKRYLAPRNLKAKEGVQLRAQEESYGWDLRLDSDEKYYIVVPGGPVDGNELVIDGKSDEEEEDRNPWTMVRATLRPLAPDSLDQLWCIIKEVSRNY